MTMTINDKLITLAHAHGVIIPYQNLIAEHLSARQLILHYIPESVYMYVCVLLFRNAINSCTCTNDVMST